MYVNWSRPKVTDWTEEQVASRLATDNDWLERALVMLYQRQTEVERNINETLDSNQCGFQRADVLRFSVLARKIQNGVHLSDTEIAYTRRPWKRSRVPQPTICKYRRQILDMIESRARSRMEVAK
jgi:hypothetical protein